MTGLCGNILAFQYVGQIERQMKPRMWRGEAKLKVDLVLLMEREEKLQVVYEF